MDLIHPLPDPPGDAGQHDGWSALCEQVAEGREAFEQGLRLTWEHEDDYDPLLGEIAAARDAMLAAEARMRLLIAYGREFIRPRPYRLDDPARAAGMSISGCLRRRGPGSALWVGLGRTVSSRCSSGRGRKRAGGGELPG